MDPTETNLLFFFNEDLPAQSRNVRHACGPVEHLGVMLAGDTPWDHGAASIFCSKTFQLEDGTYRMYYWSYGSRCCEDPSESMPRGLVATSTDRIHWERPPLGQVQVRGEDTNILEIEGLELQVCVGPSQVRLADGRWRYYFWGCENGTRLWALLAAESDDGLHFKAINDGKGLLYHPPIPECGPLLCEVAKELRRDPEEYEREQTLRLNQLQSNDASTVYYDPDRGFEIFHQYLVENPVEGGRVVDVPYNCPAFLRTISRRRSDDGIHWDDPELLIWPDEKDPWDLQFYNMPVCNYAGWRIGLLGHYLTEAGKQTNFIEQTFSRDGSKWERPLRGHWFEGGQSEDSGGIYPTGDALIDNGDHWLLYYTGLQAPHDVIDEDNFKQCTMAVRVPKNRLLAIAADKVTGGFMTEPIFLAQDEIKIDANVRGWLRAELCDIFGRKLEGYHLMDSDLISGDKQDHTLSWKGKDSSAYRYKPVCIRFEFTEGEVYCVKY
ncbi:MAG: hypothetical protein MK171_12430 [Pirellulales bacterium]|nr:hypothetical protein [Pirellulales bacterium]